MKKIFTLIAATFLTVAMFAADRRPVVTLKAPRNYEIVIDGQSYYGNSNMISLSNMRGGQHTIKVFEANKGFFGKRKKQMVSASSFTVRNNSVDIMVGMRGQISISENRYDQRNDSRDNGWDNHQGNDRNNGYGQSDSRGNDYGQGNGKNDSHGQSNGRNDVPRRF